jgi:hypothetical protein
MMSFYGLRLCQRNLVFGHGIGEPGLPIMEVASGRIRLESRRLLQAFYNDWNLRDARAGTPPARVRPESVSPTSDGNCRPNNAQSLAPPESR